MKPFSGPRHQRGFIGLAIAAAGAAYKAYESNKAQDNKDKHSTEENAQEFQDKAWLDQQQRKFQLQDRQYEENAIRQYAPFYKGPAMPDPKLTDTTGLADWQPNGKGPVPILQSSYRYAEQPNG
jgi:hypothetical protein